MAASRQMKQAVGGKGQHKAGKHRLKKHVGVETVSEAVAEADHQAAQTAHQGVHMGAAEQIDEAPARHDMGQHEKPQLLLMELGLCFIQKPSALLHRGLLPAQAAAQGIVPLQALQVVGAPS